MMTKKPYLLHIFMFFALFSLSSTNYAWNHKTIYSFDKTLFVGSIVFPQTIKLIPEVSIYRGGVKIKTDTDHTSKKTQFTISDDKSCTTFYILVTQNIQPCVQDNTVKYLQVAPNERYKLYTLEKIKTKDSHEWRISLEENRKKNRVIPDDTLIVIFNSDYVEKLARGNELELPRIIIQKNILDLVGGTEEKLHETEAELILSSLDHKLIHPKLTSQVKQDYKKKIVVVMSNP